MTTRKLLLFLSAAAVALAAAPAAMAAFPGKNGLIAFQKSKGGALVKDLFVMNPNGSGQTDITNTPKVSETDPSFAPDGRRLVFLWQTFDYKHAGIGVMKANGTGMRRIVSGTPAEAFASPSWTADGKSIVYTRLQGTNPPTHVYVVGANGGSQRQLSFGDEVQDFQPLASPTGSRIVFYSYPPGSQGSEIMMNADGSAAAPIGDAFAQDWSPDGNRFIFERDHDIYASALDGSGLTKLAALPRVDETPAWSPDGKRFIFTSEGQHDIFVANSDGSGLKNLTRQPGFEHDATWGVFAKNAGPPKKKHHKH
jgi:Tol biopolymer transport system component